LNREEARGVAPDPGVFFAWKRLSNQGNNGTLRARGPAQGIRCIRRF
jgi:hypothetical protein